MEWFRKGAAHASICQLNILTRGLIYTDLDVIVCNILQEHKINTTVHVRFFPHLSQIYGTMMFFWYTHW